MNQESDLRLLQNAVKGRGILCTALSTDISAQGASSTPSAADPWPFHILGPKSSSSLSSGPKEPCANLLPGELGPAVHKPEGQPEQAFVPCRELSSASVILPGHLEAGDPFALNAEGVNHPVIVNFPKETVAGTMYNFKLENHPVQWDIPAASSSAATLYGATRMTISDTFSRELVSTIGCDGGCNKWIPLAEAGLSQSEADALTTWSCPACIKKEAESVKFKKEAQTVKAKKEVQTVKVKKEVQTVKVKSSPGLFAPAAVSPAASSQVWTPADDALLRSIHPDDQSGGNWDQCAAQFEALKPDGVRSRTASGCLNRHYVLKNGHSYDEMRKSAELRSAPESRSYAGRC